MPAATASSCDLASRPALITDLKDCRVCANALGSGHVETPLDRNAGLSQERLDANLIGQSDDIAAARSTSRPTTAHSQLE
jgi:hypothetical protein